MFYLKVLGSVSLYGKTTAVPAGAQQKRRLGLLAVLAIAGGRGISRDRIQSYLWPESDGSRARHALDQLVYATRRALGADPILAEGQDLRLNLSVVDSDLHHFDEAIRDTRLADAASGYGGPLLDGFHLSDSRELETWIDVARSRAEQQYHKALGTLASESSARGDHAKSVEWMRKLSVSDPLSASVATGLIEALCRTGDTTGAIRHARSYQRFVRSELEVDADPRIEEIISSLSAQRAPHVPPSNDHRAEGHPGRASGIHTATDVTPSALPSLPAFSRRTERSRGTWLATSTAIALAVIASAFVFTSDYRERSDSANSPGGERSTISSEAQLEYRRGVNAWNDRSREGLDTAVIYFRHAIELEPLFSAAHAGLANAYVMLGYSGYRPAEAMFPKAKEAALRSIELDSALAAPRAALGMELTWERDFRAAEVAYQKAIALDARYATAHQWYGILLMILGRQEEAVAETGRAAALDPLSLQIQNNHATFLSAAGNHAEAIRHYRKMVDEEPDSAWVRRNPWLLTNIAGAYATDGQFDKALRFATQAVHITSRHPRSLSSLAGVYLAMGKVDQARKVFARADTANEQYPAYRAFMYAKEGELDSAFIWFDRVKQWGIPVMISLRNQQELRKDARYAALLRRLGMPVVSE